MVSKRQSLLLLLLFSTKCFAQSMEDRQVTDVTRITFFDPGVSYEKAVGRSQTLLAHAFLRTSFSLGYSSTFGNTSSISFDPALFLQYRFYCNYARRLQKGKRTDKNSLNYIAPAFETYLSKNRISDNEYAESKRRLVNTIGVVWGLQRNYSRRFSLDLNIGPGYLFTTGTRPGPSGEPVKESVGKFSTLGQITLGFWLGK